LAVDSSPHLLIRRRSCPHNRPARKFEAEQWDCALSLSKGVSVGLALSLSKGRLEADELSTDYSMIYAVCAAALMIIRCPWIYIPSLLR
jgi:hypothetical protein